MNRRRVLIETSWNVKDDLLSANSCSSTVLIETSWNVKPVATVQQPLQFRINRNIVECKVWKKISNHDDVSCINRNIVECKAAQSMKEFSKEIVLIETSWNVKFARASVST